MPLFSFEINDNLLTELHNHAITLLNWSLHIELCCFKSFQFSLNRFWFYRLRIYPFCQTFLFDYQSLEDFQDGQWGLFQFSTAIHKLNI